MKAALGDRITCPYCERSGKLADNHGAGNLLVVHAVRYGTVISAATGLPIECEIVVDACLNGQRIGEAYTEGSKKCS